MKLHANVMVIMLATLPGLSAAATFLGPGVTAGQLSNPSEMNAICRDSYANEEDENGSVRWASTRDFHEASNRQGWGGDPRHFAQVDKVALRADNTIISSEGRLFDQATGAISGPNQKRYPGAVILTQSEAYFANKKTRSTPMCVFGTSSAIPR